MIPITKELLEAAGFEDQTGGWGGCSGANWQYKKGNLEIRQVDYDDYWHKCNSAGFPSSTRYRYMEELENLDHEKRTI